MLLHECCAVCRAANWCDASFSSFRFSSNSWTPFHTHVPLQAQRRPGTSYTAYIAGPQLTPREFLPEIPIALDLNPRTTQTPRNELGQEQGYPTIWWHRVDTTNFGVIVAQYKPKPVT
jgi:hypothetical protein